MRTTALFLLHLCYLGIWQPGRGASLYIWFSEELEMAILKKQTHQQVRQTSSWTQQDRAMEGSKRTLGIFISKYEKWRKRLSTDLSMGFSHKPYQEAVLLGGLKASPPGSQLLKALCCTGPHSNYLPFVKVLLVLWIFLLFSKKFLQNPN